MILLVNFEESLMPAVSDGFRSAVPYKQTNLFNLQHVFIHKTLSTLHFKIFTGYQRCQLIKNRRRFRDKEGPKMSIIFDRHC